ncbi:MAG: UvrD-helicase domain-containing protein [Gammaproteobacteria bacterium]
MKIANSPSNRSVDSLTAAQPDINATVSASAGTGKTWLLVTRIIRLLLADTEPGSILALTFTRKAAAEMQMRLQERLYQMATADDATLTRLLTQAGVSNTEQNIIKSRALYEKLLHADFPVRLQTFHSFCQDILSHFPLEADITPGFELLENTALLQQQALEELFAEATRDAQGKLANDLDILMQNCNGPANTKTALNSMLDHRSDWWSYCEHSIDKAAFASEQLQQQLQIQVNTDPFTQFFTSVTREQLIGFIDCLRKHPTKTNLSHAQQIEQALKAVILHQSAFNQLQPVFLTASCAPRARKSSKAQAASMGSDGETAFLALHTHICSAMQDALEISKRIQALALNSVWYRTGQRYIELYQQLKRELRVLDFTDLEWNCYRLLNTADNAHWVQYKIDQRINHVLIDEFQDTNPTQWQLITPLLEEIAAGPGERARSFFLVGDEKQSIYSFRRANPELQRQASIHLALNVSAVEVRLDASRRSSPAIIETVNAVFNQDGIQQYMPEFSNHATHLQQLPGRASLFPLHRLDNDDAQISASDSTELRNPLLCPRAIDTRTARIDEANMIADQIENLVETRTLISTKDGDDNDGIRPLEYGDIMILLRNRTHIGVYESVLRERGIPFTGSQRGGLLDNQEIQDLEKLLDSLMAPFNNLSIAQVLKSPIFAASDADLMRIAQWPKHRRWYQRLLDLDDDLDADHPLYRASRLLPRWHKLADTMPVHDLLDRIYAEGNIIQRYVSSVPAAQRQRVSANLLRFLELSLELDSGRYPSLSHFLHYLRSIRQQKNGRPDEPAVSRGQSSVSLMTIHASKGLEAPVVILADCDNQGRHNDAYSALVDWPAQSNKPVRFQLITGQQQNDQTTVDILKRKKAAQQREELNLLYVALTRARQYLLITGSACRDKSGWFEYLETAMKTRVTPSPDNAYHFAVGEYPEQAVINTTHAAASKEPVVDARLKRPIQTPAAPLNMVAPSLSFHHDDQRLLSSQDSEGARRGIIIHRALDLMSRNPPLTADQARRQIRQESTATDDADLEQWLDEACKTVNDTRFEAIFKPTDYYKVMNELPVLYQDRDQAVFGLIDRLIVKDDYITLIDYKTHRVDDETQLEALTQAYRHQINLYKTGVNRLWPHRKINSGLLFTHSARLVWVD